MNWNNIGNAKNEEMLVVKTSMKCYTKPYKLKEKRQDGKL